MIARGGPSGRQARSGRRGAVAGDEGGIGDSRRLRARAGGPVFGRAGGEDGEKNGGADDDEAGKAPSRSVPRAHSFGRAPMSRCAARTRPATASSRAISAGSRASGAVISALSRVRPQPCAQGAEVVAQQRRGVGDKGARLVGVRPAGPR